MNIAKDWWEVYFSVTLAVAACFERPLEKSEKQFIFYMLLYLVYLMIGLAGLLVDTAKFPLVFLYHCLYILVSCCRKLFEYRSAAEPLKSLGRPINIALVGLKTQELLESTTSFGATKVNETCYKAQLDILGTPAKVLVFNAGTYRTRLNHIVDVNGRGVQPQHMFATCDHAGTQHPATTCSACGGNSWDAAVFVVPACASTSYSVQNDMNRALKMCRFLQPVMKLPVVLAGCNDNDGNDFYGPETKTEYKLKGRHGDDWKFCADYVNFSILKRNNLRAIFRKAAVHAVKNLHSTGMEVTTHTAIIPVLGEAPRQAVGEWEALGPLKFDTNIDDFLRGRP